MRAPAWFKFLAFGCAIALTGRAQAGGGPAGGSLSLLSDGVSRSISAENFDGAKGRGGMAQEGAAQKAARALGQGWKVSPYVVVQPGETFTVATIAGPGTIRHIWMCVGGNWQHSTLRMYWDGEQSPSVETPVGDFFAQGWKTPAPLYSLMVCVNPRDGFNCYWDMPFRRAAKITLENTDHAPLVFYYQVDYELGAIAANSGYFHAQYRRGEPLPYKSVYTILDGVKGKGQYVGTYMAWSPHGTGWWGEGEIKFYLDGDKDFPTICGTGTEDYFCGSNDFRDPVTKQYREFTSPYSGLAQVVRPDGKSDSPPQFGMYRWHIRDPIRFEHDLRVTMQDLGWKAGRQYLPLRDGIASVAFWYQTEPHAPFPAYPGNDAPAAASGPK